jgi:hypothetical protein
MEGLAGASDSDDAKSAEIPIGPAARLAEAARAPSEAEVAARRAQIVADVAAARKQQIAAEVAAAREQVNMVVAAEQAKAAVAAALPAGTTVVVRGLVSAAEHNGQQASVRRFVPAKGRYELALLGSGKRIFVKAANVARAQGEVRVGLGRIIALHYRSSASHQIR